MNHVVLVGRLVRDPIVNYTKGEKPMAITRYKLAVDREYARDKENNADFIDCVAIGRRAEFAEKYFYKGLKIIVTGRIQTGSYVDKEGRTVYTTDVFIDEQDFAQGKKGESERGSTMSNAIPETDADGYMNIPDDLGEKLPFA